MRLRADRKGLNIASFFVVLKIKSGRSNALRLIVWKPSPEECVPTAMGAESARAVHPQRFIVCGEAVVQRIDVPVCEAIYIDFIAAQWAVLA